VKKKMKVLVASLCLFLIFPTMSLAHHTVKSGDTLWKISQQYDIDFKELLSLNPHFVNPNNINVGDHVILRGQNLADDIVDYAQSLQDVTTYQYGGQSFPMSTDCSGWVQGIYKKFGVHLPRTSREQARIGTPIQFKDMKKGDLMFFSTRDDKVITHVGIYLGGDHWISNLNSKKDVTILSNWGSWTQKYYLWSQRVI
jgi:cell wall-associated NlpC family hydrolase